MDQSTVKKAVQVTTGSQTPKFADANQLDKKIPKNLLMMYQKNWYILKAGLEWKANYLFGGGTYGVITEIVEKSPDYVLAKATLKTRDGIEFSNYGEASKANVTNPLMHKYLLHLAVTRAECRVLRMATACGYTSVDEMNLTENGKKTIPVSENEAKPATQGQLDLIKKFKGEIKEDITFGEAARMIAELVEKKA